MRGKSPGVRLARITKGIVCSRLRLVAVAILGCGDDLAGTGRSEAGGPGAACVDDYACQSGLGCVDSVCTSLDGGLITNPLAGPPQITVEPTLVDFGAPLIGSETTIPVTISNIGGDTLIVPAIDIIEVEDAALPLELSLSLEAFPILIEPGQSTEVEVTLHPEDGREDAGYLIIANNDPDEADSLKRVELVSDIKGDPILEICVHEDYPPPGACELLDVLDFGLVPFSGIASRVFSLRNLGDGNRPIVLEDIGISNSNSHFVVDRACDDGSCDLFIWGGASEVLLDEGLPFLLRPGDLTLDDPALQQPNQLFGRVTFIPLADPAIDGLVPAERVLLETDLEDSRDGDDTFEIPVAGAIVGCRPGFFDADGQAENGCEYPCVPTGEDETACDGVDDDCDTLEDEDYVPFSCGAGGCETLSTCLVGEEACTPSPPDNDDDCDGVDDDCDGVADDDWAAYSCGIGACVNTATCAGGVESCVPFLAGIEECNDGIDDDCDGAVDEWEFGDLFEGGSICATAESLGSVEDSADGSLTASGVIHSGDDDWYSVIAVDDTADSCSGTGDEFNFRVCWVVNPGSDLRLDVHQGSCPPAASSCTGVADIAQWDFSCPDGTDCCTGTGSAGTNFGAVYYIRVYRAAGEPVDCSTYTFKIANGSATCP